MNNQQQAHIIQELLFENKDNLPDGDYLKMMNALQSIVKDSPDSTPPVTQTVTTTTTTTTITAVTDEAREPTWGQWRKRAKKAQDEIEQWTNPPSTTFPRGSWKKKALYMEELLNRMIFDALMEDGDSDDEE